MGKVFLIAKKHALADSHTANARIDGVHAGHGVVLAAGAVGDERLFVDLGRHAGEQRNLVVQVVEVVASHLDRNTGLRAASLHLRPTIPDGDLVPAKALESDEEAALEPVPVGEEQNDRGNAPSHAQHGQQAAAAVVLEGRVGLAEQIAKHSYSARKASTGSSNAALRAG